MRQYTVKHGETLRMIAQRELGDASRWEEIVDINNLSYPYVTSVPSFGTITPGDTIRLPYVDTEISNDVNLQFGTDLLLLGDKFNLSTPTGGDLGVSGGDYSLVSGIPCVKQDYAHRLMTPYGTLPYHNDYGSIVTQLIGAKRDTTWRVKMQLEIERTLRADDRVTDIPLLELSPIDTGIRVRSTAVAQRVAYDISEVIR
ncbi:hypothetical protein EalM132_00083 [Exiguobacterium phage vB_EalM-132]|nr:hypothetical protein EalM132_00083 [Exiguobacterium phage vB_EalM-132]